MQLIKIRVYEPAMCCSSGVCGAEVDGKLVNFAAFLNSLDPQAFSVERFNLSQTPEAFAGNPQVAQLLKDRGVEALPVAFADEKLIFIGSYPTNEELKALLNLPDLEIVNQNESTESGCDAACGCHAQEPSTSTRWLVSSVIGIIVLILVFRAVGKNDVVMGQNNQTFQVSQLTQKTADTAIAQDASSAKAGVVSESAPEIAVQTINSMNDLNTAAASVNAVFVVLQDSNGPGNTEINSSISKVVKSLDSFGIKAGVFALAQASAEFGSISKQIPVPSVLALVKGGGMTVVSKDINESNLMQAFVAASRSGGGCGTSSSGCAPSGCN